MPAKLKVAVVGCGVGKSHVAAYQNLPDLYDLLAICDVVEAKAQQVAGDFGIPRVSTDLGELCRMDDLDVIDICTPPYLHYAQIQQVLAAGKHAICEKPLVGSLREVDEIARAEAAAGKRVLPIFQNRFGHGLQKLKFLIAEGVTGPAYLTTVETAWRRRADYYAVPWRGKWQTELGGTLITHAIHAHDMLTYVLGPIRSVFARTATRVNPIEGEDCASVSLEMADGSLASLSATVGSAVEISRHRFCFRNLTAESNTRPYGNSREPWTFTGDAPEWTEQISETLARFVLQPEGYEGEFSRFYCALQDGTELPVTLADARTSLELLTAMYHSAQTGQPATLPLGEDHPKYAGWLP
ncbi:MAG: Gfo/Idh/MocA family oxidoreductase [Anaerolineae bacterium]|nr:Gfo/Idh/MocA family oxidoreductase [Anaerolineae bacterium]